MTNTLADKLEEVDTAQQAGIAVEPRQKTARDLVLELESSGQLRRALPKHINEARFVRLIMTALRTVPRLAECSVESILAGVMQAAQLGLEIDAVRGQAFLIPRKNSKTRRMEASFQLGYRGLIDLAGRGGITVRARDVCDNDVFEFEDGLDPKLRHVPELKRERGEPWAYFAVATFPDRDEREFVVMSRAEIERHRDRFAPKYNGKVVGPWVDHFDAMARKSVILRLLGQLPLPVDVVDAIATEAADIDVPMDVTPPESELPPAPPEEDATPPVQAGRSGGTPPSAPNEGSTPPPRNASDVPPGSAPPDPETAAYMLDEARKVDPDGVKKWMTEAGIPTDSRKWTAEQIAAVIDWITAEPDPEATS